MLKKGDVFAGYAIQRVLGHGGMGTVYLARHPRLPRLTALKLLNPQLYSDDEIRGRFEREADLVAQLDHPNIVTVYDRGTEDQQLWISMQFVPGADASSADVNVLAPGRAVQIIGETAAALDFAHANSVLHRDVKPANILLAKAPIGQPERVLLTDFGIAGVRDSDTTLGSAGSITATLAYAAPEQLLGLTLDDRADQYSLACTLFWMLTGMSPYPGTNPMAVINGHLHRQVPALSRTHPGLPPALDGVLARAMAKRPTDRFDSCAAFAAAARRALTMSGPPRTDHPNTPTRFGHLAPGRPAATPTGNVPTYNGTAYNGPARNMPPTNWSPQAAPPSRPPYSPPARPARFTPNEDLPTHAGPPPHPAPPDTGIPHRPSPETRVAHGNLSPTEASRPSGRPVPPAPPRRGLTPPETSMRPETRDAGNPSRPAGTPENDTTPRPPTPPRRTPRRGTIALPDMPVRRPRPAVPNPEQRPPP
ncbi:serine/threonine-protein kinase [Nocardia australiensis]|uniref:serine/threonine-protein kinase n=1 Tax=Nocardia australiensis TaxID=2887191 RepID=UPI001D145A37|nr:serine/threonine-protein kinase [Nocardia australiensis]